MPDGGERDPRLDTIGREVGHDRDLGRDVVVDSRLSEHWPDITAGYFSSILIMGEVFRVKNVMTVLCHFLFENNLFLF